MACAEISYGWWLIVQRRQPGAWQYPQQKSRLLHSHLQ
jgi:hypothetical protein